MATIDDIYRAFLRQQAMFDSMVSTTTMITKVARAARAIQNANDGIERFFRDWQLVDGYYRDTIRPYLAERGWYVGASLTARQLAMLKRAISEGEHDVEIEEFMIDHIRSIVGEIERRTIGTFPDRAQILSDALNAHKSGTYSLSIPSFLAQADGIALDILGAFAFTNHLGKIAVKSQHFIESCIPSYSGMSSYIGILLEAPGIRLATETRDQRRQNGLPISSLNRHGVMHGIDLDYATEANGLRILSLIDLLVTIRHFQDPRHKVNLTGE